jgi:hypothetical protein
LKDPRGAAQHFKECLKIRETLSSKDPANYRKQMDLMLVLPHCGQHQRAAQLAEKLRVGKQKDRELLLTIARCYAQCAAALAGDPTRQQQNEEKALAAMRDAVGQGYKDLISLETDPDLDPVRERPEFQKLLADIKSKQVAAAKADRH